MSLTAYGLRCEYRVTPLGMDEPRPRLSWRLRADEPGQQQTAYRITIGDAWDSGSVVSGPASPNTPGPRSSRRPAMSGG